MIHKKIAMEHDKKIALVAQAKFNNGLLRAPFADIMGNRKILTLYWTSKVERYWGKEAKDEDKI